MGLYVQRTDIEKRLLGKVRFTTDANDENAMHVTLLDRLIREAESQVELDLSPRYYAPFQTEDGKPFTNLPQSPTKRIIQTIIEIQCILRILEEGFGAGGVIDGSKYAERLEKRYKDIVQNNLLKKMKKDNPYSSWFYPPLPSMLLNYQNKAGDRGFVGQVHVTSSGYGEYPKEQINTPGQTWWNGEIDDL